MIELGGTTEVEMIVAFLKAEIDSDRQQLIVHSLNCRGRDRNLIDNPNLLDEMENADRKSVLCYRGYEKREWLFSGFPLDAVWRRVRLEPRDFKIMRYINHQTWVNLSAARA
jgi:hypothetical protein